MKHILRACLRQLARTAVPALCAATHASAQIEPAPPASPAPPARAASNVPGQFDYYLLDIPWGPVFCSSIADVSSTCIAQRGFVVHGLWPQNSNGTWPQFCATAPAPADLAKNFDITPDLALLQHEWAKHGTCSGLGAGAFFGAAHTAFAEVSAPLALLESTGNRTFTPLYVLNMFYLTNPGFPPGSFSLSCKAGHVTAVQACFSKDLRPIRCEGLKTCDAQVVHFDTLPR